MRLSESLYTVKSIGEHGMHLDKLNRLVGFTGSENSCLPAGVYESKQYHKTGTPKLQFPEKDTNRNSSLTLSGHHMYVDPEISEELRVKVNHFWKLLFPFSFSAGFNKKMSWKLLSGQC